MFVIYLYTLYKVIIIVYKFKNLYFPLVPVLIVINFPVFQEAASARVLVLFITCKNICLISADYIIKKTRRPGDIQDLKSVTPLIHHQCHPVGALHLTFLERCMTSK